MDQVVININGGQVTITGDKGTKISGTYRGFAATAGTA
jgi:hypothetical protein